MKRFSLTPALALITLPALAQDGAELEQLRQRVQTLEQRLEATAQAVEAARPATRASTFGGYGELHYNNLDSGDTLDFHRFVLYFGHAFSDTVSFHSELELEHSLAGEGKPGEIELEQAYVSFALDTHHTARAGLFLVPVGILNETHEPPTFYGTERNPVENNIIPTTWWEGGGGVGGEIAPGWRYDLAVTSGLKVPTTGAKAYKIRDGRQKVANAVANDLAYTGRLRWTGLPGIEIGTTLQYQEDLTQGAEGVSAILGEAHAAISRGPFGLRALYARWDLDGSGPDAVGRDEQIGWYVEPSYRPLQQIGVFARYSEWNNEAGAGGEDSRQIDAGVNYWPHEQVVLKLDIQRQDGAVNNNGFNLGLGYQF